MTQRNPYISEWANEPGDAERTPPRDVEDIDLSAPPLSQRLAELPAQARADMVQGWQTRRQIALDAVATSTGQVRRDAFCDAARQAARLRIAQQVAKKSKRAKAKIH